MKRRCYDAIGCGYVFRWRNHRLRNLIKKIVRGEEKVWEKPTDGSTSPSLGKSTRRERKLFSTHLARAKRPIFAAVGKRR